VRRESDPFERVGGFAAYAAQTTVLQLAPWQCPPCWIRDLDAALKLPERRAASVTGSLPVSATSYSGSSSIRRSNRAPPSPRRKVRAMTRVNARFSRGP
jgi:hypothetical protein